MILGDYASSSDNEEIIRMPANAKVLDRVHHPCSLLQLTNVIKL